MNYLKIYNELITKAKIRHLPLDYSEVHHIIPRCMGGNNSKDNLVRLSAREHYIAHALLYKQYKTSKLAHAWFSMLRCDSNQERFFTSRQYESARKAHSEALKETMKGNGNHFYGKRHSDETKKKIGIANSRNTRSPEQIIEWIETVAKKPKTDDHRKKIGRKNMIMLKNKNTGDCVRIHKHEIKDYDLSIWVNPAILHPPSGLGSRWVTNGIINIKLRKEQDIPNGFKYGRTK